MWSEPIQDLLEIVDRPQVQPQEVAVLAGDPLAFRNLRRSRDGRGDRVPAGDRARGGGGSNGSKALALGLAIVGVALLSNVELAGDPVGVGFAFANAALFASYIVLAHRLARGPGIGRLDGLAGAMLLAALLVSIGAGWSAAPALLDPVAGSPSASRRPSSPMSSISWPWRNSAVRPTR